MIRCTSRMSEMSCSCAWALRTMVSTAACRRAAASAGSRSMCAQPRIALSGVRSSCDSVARNSSLTRPASSATVRATCASAASRWAVSNRAALSSARVACDAMASTSRTSAAVYGGPAARPSESVPSSSPWLVRGQMMPRRARKRSNSAARSVRSMCANTVSGTALSTNVRGLRTISAYRGLRAARSGCSVRRRISGSASGETCA